MQVRQDVQAERSSITSSISNTCARFQITKRVLSVRGAACGEPDLGGGVTVIKDDRRQTGDRVIGVRNSY